MAVSVLLRRATPFGFGAGRGDSALTRKPWRGGACSQAREDLHCLARLSWGIHELTRPSHTTTPRCFCASASRGCDSPTPAALEPEQNPLIEIVSGDRQRGQLGHIVPLPLRVRVVGEQGLPLEGVTIRFLITAGGGSLHPAEDVTAYDGTAATRWTLGTDSAAGHEVIAWISLLKGSPVTFTASLLDSADADVIRLENTAGYVTGVVIDGRTSVGSVNDYRATADGPVILVEPFEPSPERNELVAFTPGRPPVIVSPVPWTAGRDTVTVTFPDPIRISATVWIVKGPFVAQRDTALRDAQATLEIWDREGVGIEFDEFEIIDATGYPDARTYHDHSSWQRFCQSGIETGIGKVSGRINVYYVGRIPNVGGVACVTFIGMPSSHRPWTLAHEFGHLFGLGHVYLSGGFDESNLMRGDGTFVAPLTLPATLTEGQVFRIHFDDRSALHTIYKARSAGEATRCPGLLDTCPLLDLQLWVDGSGQSF